MDVLTLLVALTLAQSRDSAHDAGLAGELQSQVDVIRERDARAAPLEPRAALLLALVTCHPIAPADPLSALYRAEQLRGLRLSAAERQETIWSALDAVTLPSNVPPMAVLWPKERERWRGEKAIVSAVARECTESAASLAEERALVMQAFLAAASPEHKATLALHADVLARRLALGAPRRSFADAHLASAPDSALLLAAEATLDDGSASRAGLLEARGAYARLREGKSRFDPEALAVRELESALRAGDDAAIDETLALPMSQPARGWFLAVDVSRRQRDTGGDAKKHEAEAEALLALVLRERAGIADKGPNAEVVRDAVLRALAERPFTRAALAFLEAVFGRGGLGRAVFRLATLAIGREHYDIAEAALGWVADNSRALGKETQRKRAVIAILRNGDGALHEPSALLEQILADANAPLVDIAQEVLVLARSGLLRDSRALAPLKAALGKQRDDKGKALVKEVDALMRARPVSALRVSLADAERGARPEPPTVEFDAGEVYSLLP